MTQIACFVSFIIADYLAIFGSSLAPGVQLFAIICNLLKMLIVYILISRLIIF